MEKKLYWLIESNGDLSITCSNPETCMELLKTDFEDLDKEAQEETYYTVTPVWYTEEEYNNLPEAE